MSPIQFVQNLLVRAFPLLPVSLPLLEKRFIITPGIHYWCRLVTVADTNNDGLTT
jgi:hypothetical protein